MARKSKIRGSSQPKTRGSIQPKSAVGGRIGQQTEVSTVERLVDLLKGNDLTELYVKDGEVIIVLRQNMAQAGLPAAPAYLTAMPAAAATAPAAASAAPPAPKENLLEVRSPMVGTFYAAPSPDSEPYVSSGSPVADDTVICIIEAMKVMNEIKAECFGTIAEICVRNAQPVEYGQVLFRVRP